jgi:hypothetical protein
MSLNTTIYSFRVAYQSEEQLKSLQEGPEVDPYSLVLTILEDGQPSFKTLYAKADTEEQAFQKVDAYVKRTQYKDILNGKLL